jgi:L-2-hydroxyglutarate oxidase
MTVHTSTADFVIIGAGILGLSIANRLLSVYPKTNIVILEKEKQVGEHASGRNSGVLHSGIYYPPNSLKAKFCAQGAKAMLEYCKQEQLAFHQIGKVIVPTCEHDLETLELLHQRGLANGVKVESINERQLKELEPATRTATGNALFVPETAVVDPKSILHHLHTSLAAQGVDFKFGERCTHIDVGRRYVEVEDKKIAYGHLVNTAGLYADKIAKICGISGKYTMLPFKGIYYELAPSASLKLNHLIYPVPDMNVPFLGVHFTKTVHDKIYVGPTAVPALGREQYKGLKGVKLAETANTMYHLMRQYRLNHQGFRTYAHNEIGRFLKYKFVKAAKLLVPGIEARDLVVSAKVGIRAQLLDIINRQLVMDFLTEQTHHETHVLNAVSPAFTSAFSFSDHVVQLIQQKIGKNTVEYTKEEYEFNSQN